MDGVKICTGRSKSALDFSFRFLKSGSTFGPPCALGAILSAAFLSLMGVLHVCLRARLLFFANLLQKSSSFIRAKNKELREIERDSQGQGKQVREKSQSWKSLFPWPILFLYPAAREISEAP